MAKHDGGAAMSHDTQHEIWNPFGERVDRLSATERVSIERAEAWSLYLNGGGGDPSYFDAMAWLRNNERQHSR